MSSQNIHSYLLVVLLLLASHFLILAHSQSFPLDVCHPHDKKVLLRIKHHLGNPASLASWDLKNDCGGPFELWEGIRCDSNGHVTSLLIFGAKDIYTIPPFLDRLPALVSLAFSATPNLTGPIPPYIGKLTNLTNFMLYMTNVSGPIPGFLGRLTNLNRLVLGSNKLTGSIPKFLGQLKNLNELDLSDNRLTGHIPFALANLTNLGLLSLHSNKLSGPIPDFLGQQLVNLTTLNLHSNYLSGKIPKSLSLFNFLTFLSLSDNQLTGSIPESMGLANILVVRLAQNNLTGDASVLFNKNNTVIIEVDISNNFFKFDLSNVVLAPRLYSFNISHNMIYGSLPKLFYRLKDTMNTYVDVTYNQLCGPIPNGRRLKQVDPSIFAHNKCLCGGPLPACK